MKASRVSLILALCLHTLVSSAAVQTATSRTPSQEQIRKFENALFFGEVTTAASMLESGFPVNTPLGFDQVPPVFLARSPAMLDLLLSHGANPQLTDRIYRTGLHYAAAACEPERVKIWIKLGVSPNAQDNYGNTAFHTAALSCYSSGAIKLEPSQIDPLIKEITQELLNAGVNPNLVNAEGASALEYLVNEGRLDAIRVALDNGANPNIISNGGCSPLNVVMEHLRECSIRKDVQDLLLSRGAKPGTDNCILPFEKITWWTCLLTK